MDVGPDRFTASRSFQRAGVRFLSNTGRLSKVSLTSALRELPAAPRCQACSNRSNAPERLPTVTSIFLFIVAPIFLNIRFEVAPWFGHRDESVRLFASLDVPVVAFARLVVVADQAFSGAPVVQAILQPMATVRRRPRQAPDDQLD